MYKPIDLTLTENGGEEKILHFVKYHCFYSDGKVSLISVSIPDLL